MADVVDDVAGAADDVDPMEKLVDVVVDPVYEDPGAPKVNVLLEIGLKDSSRRDKRMNVLSAGGSDNASPGYVRMSE